MLIKSVNPKFVLSHSKMVELDLVLPSLPISDFGERAISLAYSQCPTNTSLYSFTLYSFWTDLTTIYATLYFHPCICYHFVQSQLDILSFVLSILHYLLTHLSDCRSGKVSPTSLENWVKTWGLFLLLNNWKIWNNAKATTMSSLNTWFSIYTHYHKKFQKDYRSIKM